MDEYILDEENNNCIKDCGDLLFDVVEGECVEKCNPR